MIKRLTTAAILLPLIALLIHFSTPLVFSVFILAVSLILVNEILSFKNEIIDPFTRILTNAMTVLLFALKYCTLVNVFEYRISLTAMVLFVFIIFHFSRTIFNKKFKTVLPAVSMAFFTFFYAALLPLNLVNIRFYPHGPGTFYIFYILTVVWLYDTGAYFTGKYWGKKKLGLSSSPQKSWAGLAGGLASGTGSGLAVYFLYLHLAPATAGETVFHNNLSLLAVLSFLLCLTGQFGDLIASIMKRSAEVKDSGTIIKGHGGLLDAIDCVIPAQFLFYIFLQLYG
ncbi:MAG TPA: phosphatidate cytidylyltransferase [Spirochaetota bacterium]|nr:phosphatidate cytidylyltransferase [Spirochaetota bacterium]